MLRKLPPITDENVLVGRSTADDAAVYRLGENAALIQTVDYFTPVVDDPYEFGQIAAANALSDVYAMGGRPLLALNIVGFPSKTLGLEILEQILKGGSDKVREAGIEIVGGHTIDDKEPKYGLSVTGMVDPNKVLTNATARPGDRLVITKPLGVGIMTTAIKRRMLDEEGEKRVVHVMAMLNRSAAEAMLDVGVNSCTDVTGFGLLGHLHEMCEASGVGAHLELSRIPVLAEAWELARQDVVPGGSKSNLAFLDEAVDFDSKITADQRLVLADAQTSGGLLISVSPEKAEQLVSALREAGTIVADDIGEMVRDEKRQIRVDK